MRAWNNLSPQMKKVVAMVGAGGVALGTVAVFTSGEEPGEGYRSGDESVRHILTDRDSSEVTIESLASQLRATQNANKEMNERMNRMRMEMQVVQESGIPTAVTRELEAISRDLDLMEEENRQLRELTQGLDFSGIEALREEMLSLGDRPVAQAPDQPSPRTDTPEETQDNEGSNPQRGTVTERESVSTEFEPGQRLVAEEVFSRPAPRRRSLDTGDAEGEEGGEGQESRGMNIISFYQQDKPDYSEPEEVKPPIYLPAGTIISGVLLNGMDAPTNQGARRDPFPATVRIKHEAILPNRYSADVKECFLIVSGHGDMSTERAYLRGETLSCVKTDGKIIEVPVNSYAVGEDGKAGLRGRLVTKQGSIIARSMTAGFFSGAAQALDVSPIPVIDTTNTSSGQTQYQSNFSPDMLQGAGAQGAGRALERVADFYLDMAENMFPVIEIGVGRQVDIMLTSGVELKEREVEMAQQNMQATGTDPQSAAIEAERRMSAQR